MDAMSGVWMVVLAAAVDVPAPSGEILGGEATALINQVVAGALYVFIAFLAAVGAWQIFKAFVSAGVGAGGSAGRALVAAVSVVFGALLLGSMGFLISRGLGLSLG